MFVASKNRVFQPAEEARALLDQNLGLVDVNGDYKRVAGSAQAIWE
jgi:hypothetical protein